MNYANAYGGNGWRPIGNYDATHYTPVVALHIFNGTLLDNSHTILHLSMTPTGQANGGDIIASSNGNETTFIVILPTAV